MKLQIYVVDPNGLTILEQRRASITEELTFTYQKCICRRITEEKSAIYLLIVATVFSIICFNEKLGPSWVYLQHVFLHLTAFWK